jgi:hypothetical protein
MDTSRGEASLVSQIKYAIDKELNIFGILYKWVESPSCIEGWTNCQELSAMAREMSTLDLARIVAREIISPSGATPHHGPIGRNDQLVLYIHRGHRDVPAHKNLCVICDFPEVVGNQPVYVNGKEASRPVCVLPHTKVAIYTLYWRVDKMPSTFVPSPAEEKS